MAAAKAYTYVLVFLEEEGLTSIIKSFQLARTSILLLYCSYIINRFRNYITKVKYTNYNSYNFWKYVYPTVFAYIQLTLTLLLIGHTIRDKINLHLTCYNL